MTRYICVHGHFYQPPRENPWLESIERQDSAHPYHDWNERVNAECYAPNRAARILDSKGLIAKIANNYARMSFNFGPTLLAWMETADPQTYKSILEADKESARFFSGHGSALAQAYNHMILPLANRRDKYTQVLWGIRDFEHRFRRAPEGMWLPETAVDSESLDIMAELGIRFTVLAPHQAKRTRKSGDRGWKDVDEKSVNTTVPYAVHLSSGRTIHVFFYNGSISRAIAFEKLLASGEDFQKELYDAFSDAHDAQLVHVATDGETYGHHHKYGDMALAYVLENASRDKSVALTNYAEFLEMHPPTHEAEIRENTSWSCAHGIERWRSDCGCHIADQPGWNQKWRKPLREALDWLRDTLIPLYEQECRRLIRDPWSARNEYISVILDRRPANIERFLAAHGSNLTTEGDRVHVLKLMELQRNALLMFTSCGWFFDDISGVEATQLLQYAGRCIELARESTRADLEQTFLRKLEAAKSNIVEQGNGRRVYEQAVKPVPLADIALHAVIRSVYLRSSNHEQLYCYDVIDGRQQEFGAGDNAAIAGQKTVRSRLTLDRDGFFFVADPASGPELRCGVRRALPNENSDSFLAQARESWQASQSPAELIEKLLPESRTSLKSLLHDDRRSLLRALAASAIESPAESIRRLYREHESLLNLLVECETGVPDAIRTYVQLSLLTEIESVLGEADVNAERLSELTVRAVSWGMKAAPNDLQKRLEARLNESVALWQAARSDLSCINNLRSLVDTGRQEFFSVSLWEAQNALYEVACEFKTAEQGRHAPMMEWQTAFTALGASLGVDCISSHKHKAPE